MPLYMDIHELHGVDAKAVAEAHGADVAIQAKYGVEYLKYWFNQGSGKLYCLCHAPNADAANRVHQSAHGFVAEQIIEVTPELAEAFLGGGPIATTGDVRLPDGGERDVGTRTVLFTDIVESTSMTQLIGDKAALELIVLHDTAVRNAITMTSGREVKHTGDGIMAAFVSAENAVRCAARVQTDLAGFVDDRGVRRVQVRIGAAAGEPVERHHDLFGSTVQLAARLCSAAEPDEILVSEAVNALCAGTDLPFRDRGLLALKGFEQPQHALAVEWRAVFADR